MARHRGTEQVLVRKHKEVRPTARDGRERASVAGDKGDMAGLEEALRIQEDNDRAEDTVWREDRPQEGSPADEPAGHLRRALRTREELQFLQGRRRKDGAEPAEEGLPCGRQPEEGRDGRDGIQVRVGQGLPLAGDRLPQRRDTRLCAVAEPEHGADRVHAV